MNVQIPYIGSFCLHGFSSSTNTEQIYVCEIYSHGCILLKVCLLSILFEAAPLESGLFIYLVFDKLCLTPSYQRFMPMFLTGNCILLIVAVSKTTEEVVLPPGCVSWVWYQPCFITTCKTEISLIVLRRTSVFLLFFLVFFTFTYTHTQKVYLKEYIDLNDLSKFILGLIRGLLFCAG